MILYCNYYRSS